MILSVFWLLKNTTGREYLHSELAQVVETMNAPATRFASRLEDPDIVRTVYIKLRQHSFQLIQVGDYLHTNMISVIPSGNGPHHSISSGKIVTLYPR